jgi:hypothetical protein
MGEATYAAHDVRPIRAACTEAAVTGIRAYVPPAIGLVAIGTPLACFAAFAHFVLGIAFDRELQSILLGAGGIAGGAGLRALAAKRRQDGTHSSQPR